MLNLKIKTIKLEIPILHDTDSEITIREPISLAYDPVKKIYVTTRTKITNSHLYL
jgi:hypothetical protein